MESSVKLLQHSVIDDPNGPQSLDDLAATYQLVWSFGQKTNNYQVALWAGGGTDGLTDAISYIHAFATWKAAKEAIPVPPIHCWLPEGVTLDLPAVTISSSPPNPEYLEVYITGWWFQTFFIFGPTWEMIKFD